MKRRNHPLGAHRRRVIFSTGPTLLSSKRLAAHPPAPARCTPGILATAVLGFLLAGQAAVAAATGQTEPDANARQALQQGQAEMAAGKFDAAVAEYTRVTRALPQFAGGYFNLGLALEQAGKLEDASHALHKALELKPGLRGANLFLGLIAYRQNHYKDAEAFLARETRIDPRDAKAFMWLGVCYLAQDNAPAAIPPLDKAYALDPTDADILYHRGHAYLLVANASYAAMFKLNHDSMRVHQVLGEAYAKGFRNQQAIAEFETAVKMAPRQPGLHEELGDQYWVVGNLDKASAAYHQELQIDPYSATTMYKLGSLLVINRNPAEGVKLLRAALRTDPSLNDAHYYLGSGLMNLGQSQEAVLEFKQAIAADPSNKRAISSYYKLAMLYRSLHQTQEAKQAMQSFLSLKSQSAARETRASAQIVRDRSALPVEDPERTQIESQP
ncbi:MAG TPA: tetratricopeptide repeat protein [Terracidiphilus sp.]|nr:tetratricopeptide repeat protein [Terracidiphilus sp.]